LTKWKGGRKKKAQKCATRQGGYKENLPLGTYVFKSLQKRGGVPKRGGKGTATPGDARIGKVGCVDQ